MSENNMSTGHEGQPTPDPDTVPEPPQVPEPAGDTQSSVAGDLPQNDEPLGEGGKKALQAERDARKQLEKQLDKLKPLQAIADALGDGDPVKGKSEIEQLTERLSQHEAELQLERSARWRAEVANDKQLTAEQAAELRGDTKEELTAHADRLLSLFPQSQTPGIPKPDFSQGGRGGVGIDIDSQIAEAQSKGDVKRVISLQNQKLAEQHNK